jgi:cell division protein FtsL
MPEAMTDPSKNTMSWGEKFVTWQALGIIMSIVALGIGWALLSSQQVSAKLEKHVEAQQALNDAVIRLVAQQEQVQRTLDKIANKLDVQ